ncbi:GNAT family N-acetyltransferase [candidate division WOR-3 bacterium]|nr:GNAT family N-acetyltransferase [candidate division WOR-3 bacterium]
MEIKIQPMNITDMRFLAEYAAVVDGITDSDEINAIETRLKRRFKNPDYIGLIAFSNDVQIGFQDGIVNKDILELNEIYVDEKYRSQGIGKRLLEAIILMAKSRSIKRITFHAEPDDFAIRKLAEKMGFKLTRIVYEKEL